MPYDIAGERFATKAEVEARCRRIIGSTKDGASVGVENLQFLVDLFSHHDEWHEKSASGVRGFTTQTTAQGTRCFVIQRRDGTEVDISFKHAVRLLPTSRSAARVPQSLRDLRAAARTAVAGQINAFRYAEFRAGMQCPVTGQPLAADDAVVDHEAPATFDVLLRDFCEQHGVDPAAVLVGSEGGTVAWIEDNTIREAWQVFHAERARLRLVSSVGNLMLAKTRVKWSADPAVDEQNTAEEKEAWKRKLL